MNDTLKNLTKLRIAGMLSETARLEVEQRLAQLSTASSQRDAEGNGLQ